MIIFHEGLPRSGKSYECLVRRIIPALQKGRAVDAYVEGLDHEKIAAAAGVDLERCRELLQVVTAEQVPTIWQTSRDNALVVIDEVQDFFGVKAKISPDMTKFITQHGHRGIDIVLMGQDFRDANALFRRRIEIKQHFLKLSGVGAENSYRVTTQRHKGHDEYEHVSTDVKKYDKKYFGTYASHTGSDIQTGNYKDDRANLLRGKFFLVVLPLALVVGGFGAWYTWRFFKGETVTAKKAEKGQGGLPPPQPFPGGGVVASGRPASGPAGAVVVAPSDPIEARLAKLSTDGDIRLAGWVKKGDRYEGMVEWIEKGGRVLQRLSVDDLRSLGCGFSVGKNHLVIWRGQWQAVAMMWPIEPMLAQVSDDRRQQVMGRAPVLADTGSALPRGGLTGLGTVREPDGSIARPLEPAESAPNPRHLRPAS